MTSVAITTRLVAASVIAMLAWASATRLVAVGPMTVDVRARAMQPGELLLVTIAAPTALSSVRVHLFDRTVTAFPVPAAQPRPPSHDPRASVPAPRTSSAEPLTQWQALVGVDLDQRPGSYVADIEATGGSTSLHASARVVILRRTFPTRTLRVSPDFVNPSAETLARIGEEQAFTRSVYAHSASTRLWTAAFVRPVPQAANSRFGTRSVFNGERRSPHAGTDFMSPEGTPVRAPNAGRIVAARSLFFTGNTVIIDHGLGLYSMLAHLSRLDVGEGEEIEAGHVVGLVGATGRVTGPHLHWALSVSGARVDPLSLLEMLGGG